MYSKNQKKKLIINADDFGWCEERDSGIIDLYQNKKISSISVLINGPNAQKSLQNAIKYNIPIGIHINLTEGTPISNSNDKNSLLKLCENTKNYIFHGKFEVPQLIKSGKIDKIDVFKEIHAQIALFVEYYGRLPTHIDGHNHIHIIPFIAEILGDLITNYWGIYRVRIPEEELSILDSHFNEKQIDFYKEIAENSKKSRLIYQKYNISSTDYFMGINLMGKNLTIERIKENLDFINKNNSESISIELMCHPGFPSKNFGDEFNKSEERLHEKQILESEEFKELINDYQLINFRELDKNNLMNLTINFLIITDLSPASGNLTQSMRIKKIINRNYNVYMRHSMISNRVDDEFIENESKDIENLLKKEKINCIIGINVWKASRLLYPLLNNNKIETINIPKIMIIAGTDANSAIKNESKKNIIINVCNELTELISLNEPMKILFEQIKKSFLSINIIENSALIETDSNYSLKKALKINPNSRIILLPASIRKVKDIILSIKLMSNRLLNYENHYFFICGSIREQNYYNEVLIYLKSIYENHANLIPRLQIIDFLLHPDFLSVVSESDLILNTSISEGMSGSILEGFGLGIPVLAKNNSGNSELIKNNIDGFLFNSDEEFFKYYDIIFNDQEIRNKIIINAKNKFDSLFDKEQEKKKWEKLIEKINEKYFKFINIVNKQYLLYCHPEIHQIFAENNNLFSNINFGDKKEFLHNINCLDLACGSGIFGFHLIEKCVEQKININKMIFSDIDMNSLQSVYANTLYNEKNIKHINEIIFIQSDMFTNIENDNKFDVILCNFPQTPFPINFKYDRWGKEDGAYYNVEFIRNVKKHIHENSIIFMIHIGFSNPIRFFEELDINGFKYTKLIVQKRKTNKNNLDSLHEGLYNYLLQLKSENKVIFEIENSDNKENPSVIFDAELLQIQLK